MELKQYKEKITKRIKEKCDELYSEIQADNAEFVNNYIKLNINYLEKYSEKMNKTNYDMQFYLDGWNGLQNLLILTFNRLYSEANAKINDCINVTLAKIKTEYVDRDFISVDEYVCSDFFRSTMHNYVDVFSLADLLKIEILVSKLFFETDNLKELYEKGKNIKEASSQTNRALKNENSSIVAFMIEDRHPIYFCSKNQAEAVELLLGKQSVFEKLLRSC